MINDATMAALTDEMIADADTAQLHEWAAGLDEYARTTTVVRFEITSEIAETPGALTAIDTALTAMRQTYAARGPIVSTDGGYRTSSITLLVWAEDARLRDGIRNERDRARTRLADALIDS